MILKKEYDYRLLTSELKNLSSNEFIVCTLIYFKNESKWAIFRTND